MKPFSQYDSSARNRLAIFLFLAVCTIVLTGIALYSLTSAYVIRQAEKNIDNLLLSHKGIHLYVQRVMLPALFAYKQKGALAEDFYAPELFSSSFIVRNQHTFYNEELQKENQPPLYYKMAATNPRNPVNRADPFEEKLIRMFNADRQKTSFRKIMEVDGKKYLYVAMPFLPNTKNCLHCHGRREDAPRQLQEIYKGPGGFNEKEGDIRAIISIRAPLRKEFFTVYIVSGALLAGVIVLFSLLFFNSRLRHLVQQRTDVLKDEIVDRQRAENSLRESEHFLDSVIENIPDMIFVKDAEKLQFVRCNRAAEDLLGFDRESLIGRDFFDLFPKELADALTAQDKEVLEGKTVLDIPVERVEIKNKGTRILHIKKIPLLDQHGQPRFLLGIANDITEKKNDEEERRQLEIQLHQAQKMEAIGTLAGGIAHDFNNLLTPIIGYTEMLLEEIADSSGQRQKLAEIRNAADRAKDLVWQILTFSRQGAQELKPLKVQSIIKEALKLLRSSIPTTIDIRQDIDPQCGAVMANPTQIHQIVMNLCTNAFHVLRQQGGIIGVSLKEISLKEDDYLVQLHLTAGRYLRLEVSDNGPGIPSAIIDRIFEPYFTTKKKGEGTGLGLSVVHGLVKNFGGHMTVYSELGKGTTFHVYLPVIKSVLAPEQTVQAAPKPRGTERILLVDDEEAILQMEQKMLESLGYKVTANSKSLEALAEFSKDPYAFDLLITDMTMPDITGAELAKKAMALRPDLPVILCTGFSELINEAAAKNQGIRKLAMKPITTLEFATIIRSVLDSR